MELYEEGAEQDRQYVKDMMTTPVEPEFTFDYFDTIVDNLATGKKRSAKALLTQDQIIPGLGNAIAQDILFRARLDRDIRSPISMPARGERCTMPS